MASVAGMRVEVSVAFEDFRDCKEEERGGTTIEGGLWSRRELAGESDREGIDPLCE